VTTYLRQPILTVSVNGIPLSEVISARCQIGYTLSIAQAEVELPSLPEGLVPFDTVEVFMGATEATIEVRFTGYVTQIENELYPKAVKLTCRGNLQKAETYAAMTDVDMTSYAYYLINGGTFGHTDETMVSTILYIVGLTTGYTPSGETPYTGIGGTGTMLGKTVPFVNTAFTWNTGESGLSFIQKLDSVCLGYCTFELADGSIVRQQISALPAVSASKTFTEHVDIYRATALDTILEAKNRIKVSGWQRNNNTDAAKNEATADAENYWFNILSGSTQWYVQHSLSSAMIEGSLIDGVDPAGLECQAVADWQLAELNVRRLRVNLTTPRDDNIAPGATIAINSPTRLGITTQNFWVQEVACEVNRQNQFAQNLVCLGVVPEPA
jgi:hypothetical protein